MPRAVNGKGSTAPSRRLAPHGMLMVDDMTATPQWDAEQHAKQQHVRQALLTSPLLTSVELRHGSGVILSTRRCRIHSLRSVIAVTAGG